MLETLQTEKQKRYKNWLGSRDCSKESQRSNHPTNGFVKKLLTKSSFHPHGIKVMLETGEVGRVKEVLEEK
ncbi:YwbE family protein [Marivirga tractuosa]|uniref:YwbE family protein n=1 Tax=Marivirga tractuosa TaxID=1006 RepID=UPI003A74E02D